jgi:hypothetical protein
MGPLAPSIIGFAAKVHCLAPAAVNEPLAMVVSPRGMFACGIVDHGLRYKLSMQAAFSVVFDCRGGG